MKSENRPSTSSDTRICPPQAGEAPMPMVGTGKASVMARATGSSVPSMTTVKAPAAAMACASAMTCSASAPRPTVRKPPWPCTDWGLSPTWPITGMPRSTRNATVEAISAPPSSLTQLAPVSAMMRAALR
ncbi:Uncharacterised protein [Bordetella pertussis]|nr:Uncharacterised protein [Bordetella pertussis]